MFDVEDEMENGMRTAVDFLNSDTNIRNSLINNIMQRGNIALNEIGFEISKLMRNKGILVKPEHLALALAETYEYGLTRYIGEYDNTSLSERDIFNENVVVSENGIDNVMRRKKRVTGMIDDLDCRDHHVPSSWADFVNRGYSQIKSTLYKQYGDEAVHVFEYYFNYDARDILKYGLTSNLTKVHDMTIEHLQNMNVAASKLEEHVVRSENKSNVSDLSSYFK